MKLPAAAAVVWMFASPAAAQFMDGNALHDYCETAPITANAYVMGVADMIALNQSLPEEPQYACIPTGVKANQARDVVCKHLALNPETRHWAAPALVMNALIEAWPCP